MNTEDTDGTEVPFLSCIPCSKKKKETDVSDVSDLLAYARD